MDVLQRLASELAITISDGSVWQAIGQALLFGGLSMLFGVWVARTVGLLRERAPAGEILAVGLASGLVVLAAWWAALASGGRSAFTPVAVGFAVAVMLGVARRLQGDPVAVAPAGAIEEVASPMVTERPSQWTSLPLTVLGGAAFVIVFALLYGSTMSASPRDGVQPVEFMDEAFYAILGRDLARTGTETIYPPSGFTDIANVPAQTWYHWGELWLSAGIITTFGAAPLAARNLIVLPVLLLAVAALSGTVVRRIARTRSSKAFVWGFLACVFLSSFPQVPGPFFSSWARGMAFGITVYGLAAVAVLLGMYCIAVLVNRPTAWALATFVGTAGAMIVPAHPVLGALAAVGVGTAWVTHVWRAVRTTRRLPTVPSVWQRAILITGIGIVATVSWGTLTGHATLGTTGSPSVLPFNAVWRDSIVLTIMWSGVFLAIPIAWFVVRKEASLQADVFFGTLMLLAFGAIAWGARLSEFTMFYFFYGGMTVIAVPVAALAMWILLERLRRAQHIKLGLAGAVLCVIQLEASVGPTVAELQGFGPGSYLPISVELLQQIRGLPPEAKLAYACANYEEVGFAGSRMLSIDAHTDRRVVPMCYQAELLSELIGATLSPQVPNAFFRWAPQRAIYPDSTARPTSSEVASFLKANGIRYIYADQQHPNSLVDNAIPIAVSGGGQVLWIP